MHSKRRLAENIAALTIVQILSYVAPLITVPYLVRVPHVFQGHFYLTTFYDGGGFIIVNKSLVSRVNFSARLLAN